MMENHSLWMAKWHQLMNALAPKKDGTAWGERILELYSQPHRAYHNLTHLQHCLRELEEARSLAQNPVDLEVALWFHDAIYPKNLTMSRKALNWPGSLAGKWSCPRTGWTT